MMSIESEAHNASTTILIFLDRRYYWQSHKGEQYANNINVPSFNRRYVWAVTLGVFLANLASPTALLDVPVGTLATLVFILISRWAAKFVHQKWAKFAIMGVLFTFSMFTIAGELTIMSKVPFWASYATIALGEAVSMAVGGVVMMVLTRYVDLDK